MKTLVFDVFGEYGHFRKYFTTSSPLTFSVPPKTAIYGIVSAILGLDKGEYLKYFQEKQCSVGIKIVNPVKKTRIPINYINTKEAIDMSKIKSRTQVNLEVLKDCRYRIYFHHKEQHIYDKVKQLMMQKKNVYTISLGLSEFIANYKFIGEMEASLTKNNDMIKIASIIPFNETIHIKFEGDREYLRDTVYNEMDLKRVITEYIHILYERKGKAILCDIPQYYRLESGENVVFL